MPWFVKILLGLISSKIRKQAKKNGVDYEFLFMKANGSQLSRIAKLIEDGKIKPIVDKVYPFDQTNEAFNYLESGCAKGKVIVKVK